MPSVEWEAGKELMKAPDASIVGEEGPVAAEVGVVVVEVPSSAVEERVAVVEAGALEPEVGSRTLASVAATSVVEATLGPLSVPGSVDLESLESV